MMDQVTPALPYRVQLSNFSGPLDLLLYLVRRSEFESRHLPLSTITSQFIEYLSILEMIDLELASEFIVVASTLVELKSRDVLPVQGETSELDDELPEPSGPLSDLVRKMLEFRRIREAAHSLEERAIQWQERYPRLTDERPVIGKTPAADRIKEVELWDLVSSLGRILKRQEVQAEGHIRNDDTPIEVYVDQIGTRVRSEGEVLFSTLFDQETVRSRIVGLFLAILELIRHHGFRAIQEGLYGEIRVLPPLPERSSQPADAEAGTDADVRGMSTMVSPNQLDE